MADGFSGARGTFYELRLCMLCVVRGYTKGLKNFQLRYQVPEAEVGKFDDVVFDEGGGMYQVFQLKHRENEQMEITSSQLFNETFTADYSLLKYVKALKDLNSNDTFSGKVRMAVVLTNIDFDIQNNNQLRLVSNGKNWYQKLTCIQLDSITPDKNAIFDTSNLFRHAKYYKFDNDPNIVHILKRQSECFSKELREKLAKQKNSKANKNGVDKTLSKKQRQSNGCTNIKYENQQKKLRETNEASANFLENLTEDDIRETLQHIIYAVRQPNDTELEQIIKNEIMDYFKLQNVDTVYNALENAIIKWCNTEDPFVDKMLNPHVIQFRDAEIFFQQNVKNVSFGDNAPTSSFTGRLNELNFIRKKLDEKYDLIVSQSITISGLGGIGKTQLTKQFIKKFGQSDFYGRVIWIEAESDESVKKSFRGLAEKINIQDRESISTTILIDHIFDYFHGFKVLFVFDNYDKSLAYAEETHVNSDNSVQSSNDREEHFVTYCQKRASDSTKNHRPYFIFTSRNQKCLPGVSSLNLSVLTKEDANELIKKGLIIQNYTAQDVEELASCLHYFPLTLQQAIAYINKKHEIESVSGGEYVIQNYLSEFAEKKEKLLNYRCENDFGEHERTTLVTWNVTLDAIRQDETNGPNAIQILQFMSYLYADRIDAKMFLYIFEDDSTQNGEAFLLLEKYSLITKIGESTFYQIHRLVQAVVQLKFKEKEDDILMKAWQLIFPKLYESYFHKNPDAKKTLWIPLIRTPEKNWTYIIELMEQCTSGQFLHYKSLETYIKNYEELNTEFERLFGYLQNSVWQAALDKDDVDQIIKLQFSQKALKEYASSTYIMFYSNSTKVIIYFLENGYIELSKEEILQNSIVFNNFDLVKYLVEKGVNMKELSLESEGLVYDIMQGKSDSLLSIIENEKTEKNVKALKESLFFATLFNQEPIVELLIANKVEPNLNFSQFIYAPIIAAAELKYPNILRILLTYFDKPESKNKVAQILLDLLYQKTFCDKSCFEIIFKKYLELGGDINDQHDAWMYGKKCTFLCYVTSLFYLSKIEIVNFLLDNDADPCVFDKEGKNALFYVLRKMNVRNTVNKSSFNDIYSKMRSKVSTEKFMTTIGDLLYETIRFDEFDKLFQVLLEEKEDINFRNNKGETLLIYFVRNLTKKFLAMSECELMVQGLLKAGVDVYAKDNDGKDALYYALDLESPRIFKFLLGIKRAFHPGLKECYCGFLLTKISSVSEEIFIKAIKEERLSCLEELLKTHFELNHIFTDGKTIIEVALENLSLETIRFLHPKFKKKNYPVVKRITELAQMALFQYIEMCSILVFEYADLNIIEILLKFGADVNAIDNDGNNALHYVTKLGDFETFRYLLRKGSKVHEKTLEYAIKQDKLQIVKKIIPKYFKKDHLFTNGLTLINLAAESKAEKVQKFLTELSSRRTCSIM